jgi:IS5 family transposase
VKQHVAIESRIMDMARRCSAVDLQTARDPDCAIHERVRERIEEVYGWANSTGGLHQVPNRGLEGVGPQVTLAATASNLVRWAEPIARAA